MFLVPYFAKIITSPSLLKVTYQPIILPVQLGTIRAAACILNVFPVDPDDHVRVTMPHDFGDPKRVFSTTQCIGGKAMTGLFHFPVGEGDPKKGHFETMIPDNEIKDAFENLARLKSSKTKDVDSIMLHAVLVLYMCAGLKKKEISEAKIKDVNFNNNGHISGIVTNSQEGNGNFVPLTGFSAQALKEYLDYLRSSGNHNLSPNSPLFPNYEGDSGQRQISRHLEKVPPFKMGDFLQGWNLDELSEFGMADHYQNEIKSGKTENQAIQNTASQYRVAQKTVTDNLNQNKKKTLNSFEKLLKHWDELVTKKSDQKEVDAFRDEGVKLIDKMRIKDKDKIKEMFNNSINDFMANLSLSKPPDAINNNPSDFKEALNNFAKAVCLTQR